MNYLFLVLIAVFLAFYFRWQKKPTNHTTQLKENVASGSSYCPYCEFEFEDKPKRNRKCPACQNKIMLRRGKLLTEDQTADYDKEKSAATGREIDSNRKQDLIKWQKSGVVKYIDISCGGGENTCDACMELNGEKMLLANEIKNPTLPVKNCTGGYGYCRCCYLPIVD